MSDRTIINGDLCHDILVAKTKQKLAFDESADYNEWKKQVDEKLRLLLGMDKIACNGCEANLKIEEDVFVDGYRRIRFVFDSEVGSTVPCYLLVPNTGKTKYPVAITMQGHSSGFHNSVGIAKSDHDSEYIATRGDFGVQAVKHGYAALCIEQRAMGERVTSRHTFEKHMCSFPALSALLLGRTTIGERVWDISRAIDLLPNFDMLDTDKILITGNSGGGTISFYAACLDERIKLSAPSCAFCSFEKSLFHKRHCACNFIPGIYEWFEMQDLACLIAPRDFIVVAGIDDQIFLVDGVKTAMDTVKKIYEKESAIDKCELVITDKGHYWCKEIVWSAINNRTKKLGWFKQ